jgi:polysaccharide export outer membrane protein
MDASHRGLARLVFAIVAMIGLRVTAPALAAAQPATAPATSGPADTQAYVLGPADVIEVDLLGQPDFTTKERIGEDGLIRLPMIGVVKADDLTAAQLADTIAEKLKAGGFYAAPIVKVDVSSFGSRYVTVLGSFTTPGLVPIDHPYRLSEIVARVGGVKDGGADYVVYRPRHGDERKIKIADLAGGDIKDDPYVSPGDKIYNPPADLVFVSGQVKLPGAFPITPGMTVRMALARGGGLTDIGSYKHVAITRDGVKQGRVDLDAPVRPGDVVVVGQRLF